MFEKISPEKIGLPTSKVLEFIDALERRRIRMHSVLMLRHGKIFAEFYWAPFNKDFCHRMYSQTKSYTSVAIGLLEEEGKLSLDAPMSSYFPEKIGAYLPKHIAEQTVREMLTMTTSRESSYWFNVDDPDRTHIYFNHNRSEESRAAGTLWEYDSAGSQVLSNLVEKLSGKTTFEYLYDKIFKHLGTFKTAEMLKVRNGDSWGDSALVCTSRDMASFAQFVMNGGVWEGRRLMNEEYLAKATSKVVDNGEFERHYTPFTNGYGYQIWRTEENSFMFNGMGSQFTICSPDKDTVFVCTADTQGSDYAGAYIVTNYFDIIYRNIGEGALPECAENEKKTETLADSLKLACAEGACDSPFRAELDGKVYGCKENPMGITEFSFRFAEDGKSGELHYTNKQGKKVLPFGVNHNVFGKFPQLGYSNDFGGMRTTDGFMYNDAVSFAWLEEKKLKLEVQIIDRYFGNCTMFFAFKGDEAAAAMYKRAEDFLGEYEGSLIAKLV